MKKADIFKIFKILSVQVKSWDVPVIDLARKQTKDPFKILIATILTARTKDSLTLKILPRLWKKVQNLNDLEKISESDLERLIYPVGFYRNKARMLKKLTPVLAESFNGVIPQSVEELILLPGVGRKTANLVVSVAFNKPAICVDVHVHRIMNRFGYIRTKNPLETELELRRKLPENLWRKTNLFLVAFGQNLCRPVSPYCSICPVKKYCSRVGVSSSR